MDARRAAAGVGRAMVTTGVVLLLFVAYQLWGTGLSEARAQDDLQAAFASDLADAPAEPRTSTTSTTAAPGTGEPAAPPTTAPNTRPPAAPTGEAVAIIRFPTLDVEKAVVEGVTVEALKKGPGHYPETPLPGRPGNVAIAGHRTTYGAPFERIDELAPGDPILITTREGRFRYEVTGSEIVRPSEVRVLRQDAGPAVLTLTTCHPRFSARQRLIISAALIGEAVDPPPAPPVDPEPPAEAEAQPEPAEERPPADLSGRPADARWPAAAWLAAAAALWVATLVAAGRARRSSRPRLGRVAAYGIGTPLALVALFLCFEAFARLLPANV